MQAQTLFQFIVGLVLLIGGAEMLVRGASRLAVALGISPLVIGLTVVAFGTGSPELAVAVRAASAGQPDLAVGNVVGSNIFNTLFILGVSALIVPLVVARQLIRFDVPVMIGVSVLLLLVAADLNVTRQEGILFLAIIAAYTALLVHQVRRGKGHAPVDEVVPQPTDRRKIPIDLLLIVAGLALLVLGSNWLVDGAVAIATFIGVSELVIGLTIVAAGTSLPEVATSIVAGIRGERDIAVGNVVGSNVYNILVVIGAAAALAPGGLSVAPAAVNFDIPVMIAAAVACLPVFIASGVIRRWQGGLFFAYWLAYTTFVILQASAHDALPAFSRIMSIFVLPLTVVTLVLLTYRGVSERMRERKREESREGA